MPDFRTAELKWNYLCDFVSLDWYSKRVVNLHLSS
jgi:hypothetical protein